MKQQQKNKAFGNIFWVGVTFLASIATCVLLVIFSIAREPGINSEPKALLIQDDESDNDSSVKVSEKIIVRDTVKIYIPCTKKHCNETKDTHIIETKETADSIK